MLANRDILAQSSIENAPFNRNDAASGTVATPLTPSNPIAVSVSPTSAPATPVVVPPVSVPGWVLPEASASAGPAASPRRQYPAGAEPSTLVRYAPGGGGGGGGAAVGQLAVPESITAPEVFTNCQS